MFIRSVSNRFFYLFISAFLLLGATESFGFIPNFKQVNAGLYRGGRPTGGDFSYLVSKGIKTVISLEVPSTVSRERRQVTGKKMKFISIPLSVYYSPTDHEINQLLQYLQDPALQPIFIHCMHGEDRTGLIMGLYRVEVDKWDPDVAYQEMLKMGFHPKYAPLDEYFKQRVR